MYHLIKKQFIMKTNLRGGVSAYLAVIFLLFAFSINAQTTVTYDFAASGAVDGLNASPPVAIDSNIGFASFKNSGTSNPAIHSSQLRLYQNDTKGGGIKIYAQNGVTITSVVVHASGSKGTGPAAYIVDGGAETDLAASTTYTMSGLTAVTEVEFYQKDASKSNRIYVDSFDVTYTTTPAVGPQITNIATTPAGGITSSDAVTVSADVTDAAGIANAALKWGTTSGSLSNSLAMTNTTADVYEAIIPAQADGTTVYYALEAENTTGDTNTSTEMSYMVEDPVVVNLPYAIDATTVNPFTDGWTTQDLAGGNSWQYNNGSGVSMNAYSNNCDAEDWLITPAFDLSTTANELLSFELYENYSGTSIDVLYSTNYDGVSDPNTATWTNITTIQTGDSGVITDNISLQGLSANKVYVAFLYEGTGGSCSDWELTNFSLEEGVTTPTILTSTASLTGLNYMDANGPSAAQSFDLSGSLLDGTQDVSIETMMGYFEVSLDDVAYADSLTLANYDGTITPVYVRLKAGHPQGMYADSVLINGYSLTEIEVSLEGEVTPVIVGATNLFFSKYVEGSSNNKYLEIYNGTGTTVDLSTYTVELYSNGGTTANNTETLGNLIPVLGNGEVIVLKHSSATLSLPAGVTAHNSAVCNFNGDDAIVLKHNGSIIDIFGNIGCDPGSEWSEGGNNTKDMTLVRNTDICGGVTVNPTTACDFPTLATEWTGYSTDTVSILGSHTANCGVSPIADYTYTSGSWSPIDPNGMALPTDNIEVLDGTATFNNAIEINNLSIATGATLEVKDVLTVNGNITNNGNITFKSTAIKTAQLDEFNGTITGSGDVTVERYIPARRAFRMLSTAVSGQTIANAWQQNTHITGDQAGNNGFDATITGNPSMFTFDNQYTTAPWAAIANTDNTTLTAGKAYRLMVRGDRTVDLTDNATPANITTLVSTGDLHTGAYNDANLNTVAGKFNFVGNPYQAVVDMNSVLPASTNLNTNNYVVWDPSLATRGAYVTIDLATGTNSSGSAANQYLQPGQAAFVTTAANGATEIAFNEVDKAVTNPQTSVFNMYTEDAQAITMQLYTQEQFTAGEAMSDSFRVNFVAGSSNAVNLKDAQKFPNLDENIALVNNNAYLSLEYRDVPQANEVLPIFINNYRATAYVMNIEVGTFENVKAYLRDNYTQEETELEAGNNQIAFNLTDEASKDANRFEIYFVAAVLGTDNLTSANVSLYPNPVNNGLFTVNTPNVEQAKLKVYSLLGQEVYNQNLTDTINTVDVSSLNAGTYIVKITSNKAVVTKKLIIK